ncbi:GNAT family N-acetyltransferase [Pseudooceanicola sp.]|jgi:ribosomal protein S18 acetylase RimI-like enzyme|uniref:GNAT family N-acetyltransferase n=1 Tax=Pseudooceanicola sp. TaxID=1914328 RepID=UPI004058383F
MISSIELRPMAPADEDACLRIWRAAAAAAHPFLSQTDLDTEEAVIAAALQNDVQATIAVYEHRIAGFIALADDAVAGLFGNPAHQGQGIGSALLQDAIAAGRARSVEVYESNVRSIGFYQRMGYEKVGRRTEDDLGRPRPLAIMQLRSPDRRDGSQ